MWILVVGIIVGLVAWVGVVVSANEFGMKMKKGVLYGGIVFSIILILSLGLSTFRTVSAGKVGILYDPLNGGVQEETLGQGLHFVNPLVKVYKLETTHNIVRIEPFKVQTMDSEFATFTVEIKYNMEVENAHKVFNAYKGMPTSTIMNADVQKSIKAYAPNYNIYDILGGQFEELMKNTEDDLRIVLAENGLNLISINFVDIDAGDLIEGAIVTKGTLKQEKEQAEQKQEIALIEQGTLVTQAETAKQVAIKNAEALAEAKTINAEAEANSIKLVQEQIAQSPVYINYLNAQANIARSENWSPTTIVTGSSNDLILDLPQ